MIADFLAALGRINLALAAATLLVLLLRRPARRLIGAAGAYRLWAIVPLACLAVLLPPRTYAPPTPPTAAATPTVLPRTMIGVAPAVTQTSHPDLAATPIEIPPPPTGVFAAWLAGAVASLGVLALRQRRFAVRLGRVRPGEAGVWLAERPGVGPAVIGAIQPRVVVPPDFAQRFTPEEQQVVLAHERSHLARHDARANGLVALAQCACWFNPLAYIAARTLRVDQELACDAEVVQRFPDARRRYAEALLKTQIAALAAPPLGCAWPAGGARPLEERIAMLKRPAPGRLRRAAGVAAVAGLCLAGGVAAWASQPAEPIVAKVAPFHAAVAPHRAARLTATKPAPPTPQADQAPPAAGDWIGALKRPDLRIAIHLKPAGDGLSGALDSPDQGAYGMPVADVSASADTLSFAVPQIKATYAAKWDVGRRAWAGTWSQAGQTWALDLTSGTYPAAAQIEGLDGGWDTQLTGAAGALRLGFNIKTDDHGTRGSMDSPDQDAYGLPLSAVSRDGQSVTLTLKAADITFTGTLGADGRSISGVFKQYGGAVPVVLTRRAPGAAAPYPPPHPQAAAPKPPVVDVEAKTLAAYAGSYRFSPGLEMVVSAEGGRLYAQLTGQPKMQIFASSPTEFFWKPVDAAATFAAPSAGASPYVVVRQGSRYVLGQRE
jgi:beta-lactamase regulating signal transducer with metallopeptidase domain